MLDNSVVEDDDEVYQEHLFNVQQYESVQEEDYFYNQEYYDDVDRILYEMENPISDEECEELCKEFFN
ncbi:hypothetical protein [Lactococcus lactis]|uniref:hypothetical protein n=1 Tax=Lactococcus lactis TaxID=1358 RepID=UPI00300E52A0